MFKHNIHTVKNRPKGLIIGMTPKGEFFTHILGTTYAHMKAKCVNQKATASIPVVAPSDLCVLTFAKPFDTETIHSFLSLCQM